MIILFAIGIIIQHSDNWKYFSIFTFLCLAVIIITGVSIPVVLGTGIEVMDLTEIIFAYTFYIWLSGRAYLLINKTSA